MLGVTPDQSAKRRRLRISHLSGDFVDRQPRGLEQISRRLVTAHLIDEAGQPTIAARDEILAFFIRRLAPGRA
jgi:hypothetical protein